MPSDTSQWNRRDRDPHVRWLRLSRRAANKSSKKYFTNSLLTSTNQAFSQQLRPLRDRQLAEDAPFCQEFILAEITLVPNTPHNKILNFHEMIVDNTFEMTILKEVNKSYWVCNYRHCFKTLSFSFRTRLGNLWTFVLVATPCQTFW